MLGQQLVARRVERERGAERDVTAGEKRISDVIDQDQDLERVDGLQGDRPHRSSSAPSCPALQLGPCGAASGARGERLLPCAGAEVDLHTLGIMASAAWAVQLRVLDARSRSSNGFGRASRTKSVSE